ncbi:tape measure protein [Andreprevotia chitinilytica]|uniref:tape measure protein n=1 Tax=Andreprevotia chitinilytica TaxID=396808 RepID=UPI00054E6F88|nr:tape measure protein [Andreprevotia chitinilytica]
MASLAKLTVDLEANIARFEQGLNRAESLARKQSEAITQQLGKVESTASLAGKGLIALGSIQLADHVVDWAAGSVHALIDVQRQFERTDSALRFANGGDLKGVATDLAWVRELSKELGLEVSSTAQAFALFSGATRETVLEGQNTKDVFRAISTASTAMGLSLDDTKGALLALTQMVSKGTVQAEEFRGQLAERLPIATKAAADALGVTTAEFTRMLNNGQVIASDFLPKFAAALQRSTQETAQYGNQTTKAVNEVSSAWTAAKTEIAQTGASDFINGQLRILSDGFEDVARSIHKARDEGGGFWSQMAAGAGGALRFLNPSNAFSYEAQDPQAQYKALSERRAALSQTAGADGTGNTQEMIRQIDQQLAKLKSSTPALRPFEPTTLGATQYAEQQQQHARILKQARERATDYLKTSKYQTQAEKDAAALDALDKEFKGATAELRPGDAAYDKASQTYQTRRAELLKTQAKHDAPKNDPLQNAYLSQTLQLSKDIATSRTHVANLEKGIAESDGRHAAALEEWLKYDREGQKLGDTKKATLAALARDADAMARKEREAVQYYGFMHDSAQALGKVLRENASIALHGQANPYTSAQDLEDQFAPGGKFADVQDPARKTSMRAAAAALDQAAMQRTVAQAGYDDGKALESVRRQIDLIGQSTREQERLNAQYQIQDEYEKRAVGLSGEQLQLLQAQTEEYQTRLLDAIEARNQKERDWQTGAQDGLQTYLDNASNMAAQTRSLVTDGMQGFENAFTNAAESGKLSFHDLTRSILLDLAKIAERRAIVGLMNYAIGAFTGDSGAVGTGGISESYSNTMTQSVIPGRAYGGPTEANGLYQVVEKGEPEMLRVGRESYLMMGARGGQVTPLRSGDVGGGGGGSPVIHLNTQIVLSDSGAQSSTSGDQNAAPRQLAEMVNQQVTQQLQRESRQGGLLWKMRVGA